MSTTLFSLAVRDHDATSYSDVVRGASHAQAVERICHHGVERKLASAWVDAAALSVHPHNVGDELAVRGDVFEHVETGPRRESFKLLAITVYAPSADR